MTRGRPIPLLQLSREERETLERWSRRHSTAQALALRCRIVLACAEGLSNTAVAERLPGTLQNVGKWRQRVVERRLDGLLDERRPGAPRKIGDESVERGLTVTLEKRPPDAPHWSAPSMAQHREMTQVQALDRSRPPLPMRPGQAERRTHDYVRHGTTSLFAALEVKSGRIVGDFHARHRSVEFRKFLDRIEAAVPDELDVHLILDNYSTHKTPLIHRWLARHPRFHVHFTPTSASWPNLFERWFAPLTEKQIRRALHRSTRELEQAIRCFIETTNHRPNPFV